MKRWMAAALCVAAAQVQASGDFGPWYTQFRAWSAPDVPLERFQAGELGIVQPGMHPVYLYVAWRALSLGPRIARMPGREGGLARADGSAFGNGWSAPDETSAMPLVARLAGAMKRDGDDPAVRVIAACPRASTTFAVRTMDAAAARADATPARMREWILAQRQVGAACQAADDARYGRAPKELLPVAPLPPSEPAYWRQLREYQRAAFAFQMERYDDAAAQFDAIGATADHPMRHLGQYLALRSAIRGSVAAAVRLDAARREQYVPPLDARAARILADQSLAPLHEATRALLRSMRVALTPERRLADLSAALREPEADPFVEDRLGDWGILMGRPHAAALRRIGFVDWVDTLRDCGDARKPTCAPQAAHALAQWRQDGSRAWLVAALMLADGPVPELERAARAVPAEDPGWLTIRYHLARLARLDGRLDEARAFADEALRRDPTPGARNLLHEERLAASRTVREAGRWLLRTNVDMLKVQPEPSLALDEDGLRWLNDGLSVADLVDLAGDASLDAGLRARVAGAAWLRAALLGQREDTGRAGALLAHLVPAMGPSVTRERRAPSVEEARHAVLVEAVRFGIAAQLDPYARPIAAEKPDEATASGWCAFRVPPEPRPFAWRIPDLPPAGRTPRRDAELAQLGKLKTATGVFGDDALRHAAAHPSDPEIPWLLHVTVMSTRGGCLDADAKALSRRAWKLLHSRYGSSEWTARTPYFY